MCRCVLHLAVDWLSDGPARLQVWCAAAAVAAGIFVAGAQGVRRVSEVLQLPHAVARLKLGDCAGTAQCPYPC